jgi:CRISPR-associated protein Cas1
LTSEKSPKRLLPARMLNEFVYCPRLFYLEWVQGEFSESVDTLEGKFAHRNVQELDITEAGHRIHSLYLSGKEITAKIDVLESERGYVVPVEYKKGKVPRNLRLPWEGDRVQLCAQGLVLEENGYKCSYGMLYYAGSKERVKVKFTKELIKRTRNAVKQAFELSSDSRIPPPLIDSPKCPRCSLVGICLPDEVNALKETNSEDVRRLFPARREALPLYVIEQGAVVGKSGEVLEVRLKGEAVGHAKTIDISQLCIFGSVMVTPSVVYSLCQRDIPICHYSSGGWFYGITHGMTHKNVELRLYQYRKAESKSEALKVARRFVEGKITNCRTMVRRNHPHSPEQLLFQLKNLAKLARVAKDVESLRGIEGAASNAYFSSFGSMIRDMQFDFKSRNRRPPADPVNALLSFLYSLLVKEVVVNLLAVGFDPYLGYYHVPKYGRPALALDLMEEFRPLIADSTALTLLNRKELADSDFVVVGHECALNQNGRKKAIEGYHRRLDTLVKHPIFGYSISYGRVIEVQARLLSRWVGGEIPAYPFFHTR